MHTIKVKGDVVIGVRTFRPSTDEGLVYNSWCNQVRKQPPFSGMDADDFRAHKLEYIEKIVARNPPLLAVDIENESHCYGWICAESGDRNTLHFVYVKGTFRNWGIGTALMKLSLPSFRKNKTYFTHKTVAVRHLESKWNLVWNPYLPL